MLGRCLHSGLGQRPAQAGASSGAGRLGRRRIPPVSDARCPSMRLLTLSPCERSGYSTAGSAKPPKNRVAASSTAATRQSRSRAWKGFSVRWWTRRLGVVVDNRAAAQMHEKPPWRQAARRPPRRPGRRAVLIGHVAHAPPTDAAHPFVAADADGAQRAVAVGDTATLPLSDLMSEAAPASAAVMSAWLPRYCWALLRRSPLTQKMP